MSWSGHLQKVSRFSSSSPADVITQKSLRVNCDDTRMRRARVLFKSLRTMSTSRQENITTSLSSILSTIESISSSSPARLVAVSKYISTEDIRRAYTAGQRHFGENYIQELIMKSVELPDDIKWHFIGALQSNKCKMLVEKVKNLWCVETVDSEKKARLLESGAAAIERKELLKVFVQVNTSGEERMSGLDCKANCRESGCCTLRCF